MTERSQWVAPGCFVKTGSEEEEEESDSMLLSRTLNA